MPFAAADVRRILSSVIVQTQTAPSQDIADKLAATLSPVLAPALDELDGGGSTGPTGPLMTAAEALFVRDTVAAELEAVGGGSVAERLLMAGYIDVAPILALHRSRRDAPPTAVAAATGPLRVPAMPLSSSDTGRIARSLTSRGVFETDDDLV